MIAFYYQKKIIKQKKQNKTKNLLLVKGALGKTSNGINLAVPYSLEQYNKPISKFSAHCAKTFSFYEVFGKQQHPKTRVYSETVLTWKNFFRTYFTASLNFFPTSCTHFSCSLLKFFPIFNFG